MTQGPPGSRTPFDSLDFIYMPSSDLTADLAFHRDVLGGEVVFAIEAFGVRVAQVRLSGHEPRQPKHGKSGASWTTSRC